MIFKARGIVALSVLLCSPALVASSGANQLAQGSIEIAPSVTFNHENFKREGYGNVDHQTELTITPTIGYCVSDRFEVMSGLMVRHESFNDQHETSLGALAGLNYNFPPHGTIVPFVGLGFGVLFYDGFSFDNTAVLAPMLSGGMRVLIGSSASVNMSLGYQHESNAGGEFNATSNKLLASVGVSLFPWPPK